MKPPATASLDNIDFAARKLPLKNQLSDRNVARYDSVLKISPFGPRKPALSTSSLRSF